MPTKTKSASSTYGGQAVIEGVMMRSTHYWAVAVRKTDGTIAIHDQEHESLGAKSALWRLPIVRGPIALGEAMVIGFRALRFSSSQLLEDVPETSKAKIILEEEAAQAGAGNGVGAITMPCKGDEDAGISGWQMAIILMFSLGFSILLFKLLPAFLASIAISTTKTLPFVLLEGAIKVSIFISYVWLIGKSKDIGRTYQYHSAEHKAINALEHGVDMSAENVNRQSRIHVRCGTAFMLWVFMVAIVVFGLVAALLGPFTLPQVLLSRVILLPLIAGLSFEIIRFAGKHADNNAVRTVLAPGLWLQRLTTRECDPEHCKVALAALNRVRDLENTRAALSEGAKEEVDAEPLS